MAKLKVLFSWVADRDFCALYSDLPENEKGTYFASTKGELRISGEKKPLRLAKDGDPGPLGTLLSKESFDEVVLISDRGRKISERYKAWATSLWQVPAITTARVKLKSAFDYPTIYAETERVFKTTEKRLGNNELEVSIHLTPGTRAMGSVLVLLGKTHFSPEPLFYETYSGSPRRVSIPFNIDVFVKKELSQLTTKLYDSIRPGDLTGMEGLTGDSPAIRKVKREIALVAQHDCTCLIQGETGCGKEVIARLVHEKSARKNKPFIAINCGAIPANLAESELFGHAKGSFTGAIHDKKGAFEQADGGTLFLDEIGEMPLDMQVKILRALQEKKFSPVGGKEIEVDIRILSATNRDLLQQIDKGQFRNDLYYRLIPFQIQAPPLREHLTDIPQIAEKILQDLQEEMNIHQEVSLAPSAINKLKKHRWPGNVRELQAVLRRALIFLFELPDAKNRIDGYLIRTVLKEMTAGAKGSSTASPLGSGFSLKKSLQEHEKEYIREALHQAHDKQREAATLLGLSPQSLNKKMQVLGLR